MNLPQLRYFVTLAHVQHYTKAAEMINITQPCMTYTVRVLEEELGVKLFEKDGRNVALTKYGKMFLQDVESILEQLDHSVEKLQRVGRGSGEIVIAFLRTLGVDFIPWLMKGFLQENSEKEISFIPFCDRALSMDIIADLKVQKYDIAFCSKIEDEPSVDFIPVFREELVLITPLNHPLAEKTSVTLDETLPYKHVTFKPSSGLYRTISDMFINTAGRLPDSAFELEEDEVIAGFVAHSSLIAIVPNMPVLKSIDVKVLPLKNSAYERNFYMATPKNAYQSPALVSFIEYVKENAWTYSENITPEQKKSAPERC